MRIILLILGLLPNISMSYNNNHEYFYFDGLENDNPVSYRGVKKPLQAKGMYSDLVIINWAYEEIYNGLASRETNDAQNKFEDVLDTIEDDDLGIIAVVIFGDGRKDWFCYVTNFEKFMVEFNEKFKNHPKYPITIESRLDDNWNFHSGFIKWASDR